jgi:hypothetical protein
VSYIADQVAEFFAERGLLPVVTDRSTTVHAAYPDRPSEALCPNRRRRDLPLYIARGDELELPPCRGCTKQHIQLRLRGSTGTGAAPT